MSVLRARLSQISSATLDVRECKRRRQPDRRGGEASTALVGVGCPSGVELPPQPAERGSRSCWNAVEIVELDAVVAGVVLTADEPGRLRDDHVLSRQQPAHLGLVGHRCKGARVGTAVASTARAAVVGRFLRVVEARRAVAQDQHQRRETFRQTDLFERRTHDRRHLLVREAGPAALRGCERGPFEGELGRRPWPQRRAPTTPEPFGESRKQHAQNQRDRAQHARQGDDDRAAHQRTAPDRDDVGAPRELLMRSTHESRRCPQRAAR